MRGLLLVIAAAAALAFWTFNARAEHHDGTAKALIGASSAVASGATAAPEIDCRPATR